MAQAKDKPAKAAAQQRAREAARAEAARLKSEAAARERRLRLIYIGAGVALLVAVAVIVVLVLQSTTAKNYDEVDRPAGANEYGAIALGQDMVPGGALTTAEDAVVVRIYADYMCPGCATLEGRLGSKLTSLAEAGEIKLEILVVSYLDRMALGTQYSTRAANAAATVAHYAPEQYWAFHAKLFESDIQPGENTEGLSDERLAEIAQQLGVPADVTDRFAAREFDSWVTFATDQAKAQGVGGTPGLAIGKSGSDLTLAKLPGSIDLDAAIARVRAGQSPD
ncbi:MAG: thioredoxin domain-containing protein [Bifidobacteriaceae bacterium]|jgi:protein-disulfide isomerase|nr:thioredoxin domain-containing protein [Bifidobacteriaceae bacterium]